MQRREGPCVTSQRLHSNCIIAHRLPTRRGGVITALLTSGCSFSAFFLKARLICARSASRVTPSTSYGDCAAARHGRLRCRRGCPRLLAKLWPATGKLWLPQGVCQSCSWPSAAERLHRGKISVVVKMQESKQQQTGSASTKAKAIGAHLQERVAGKRCVTQSLPVESVLFTQRSAGVAKNRCGSWPSLPIRWQGYLPTSNTVQMHHNTKIPALQNKYSESKTCCPVGHSRKPSNTPAEGFTHAKALGC